MEVEIFVRRKFCLFKREFSSFKNFFVKERILSFKQEFFELEDLGKKPGPTIKKKVEAL
jgi:hypothetical protein